MNIKIYDVESYKYDISNIKRGLPVVVYLTDTLNDKFKREKMFKELWPDAEPYFIDYLKSKMGSATSHHTDTVSGGRYIAYKNMPCEDRIKIINWSNREFNIDMRSIKVTLWFIKWCFCDLGIFWMMDVLGLDNMSVGTEWQTYKNAPFDHYFASLTDDKLQKYIDKLNEMRLRTPDLNELVDVGYMHMWNF